MAVRIKNLLNLDFGSCSVGISACLDLKEVAKMAAQAQKALEQVFYKGRSSLNFYEERTENEKKVIPYQDFILDISCGNIRQLQFKLDRFFQECEELKSYEPHQITAFVEFILVSIAGMAKEESVKQLLLEKSETLCHMKFLSDIKRCAEWCLSAMDLPELQADYSPTIQRCVEYIMLHYMEPLSLNEISDSLKLAPSYLSKAFTREVGINLTSYIHKIKIKYAKEMLKAFPQLSVTEIAGHLSFESVSYFSYLFERYTKMTPTEYRKQGRKKDEQTEHTADHDRPTAF